MQKKFRCAHRRAQALQQSNLTETPWNILNADSQLPDSVTERSFTHHDYGESRFGDFRRTQMIKHAELTPAQVAMVATVNNMILRSHSYLFPSDDPGHHRPIFPIGRCH